MAVRAKFKVAQIDSPNWGDGYEGVRQIALYPVVDGSPENKAFYAATPGGSIILATINAAAAAQFEIGQEFYVDFTPAEE